MLLDLASFSFPMVLVYELSEELKSDPRRVEKTQALTLDQSRPLLGLAGKAGLFGSTAWWDNIVVGRLQTELITGVISRTFFAGQDARWGNEVNAFGLLGHSGVEASMSIPETLSKQTRRYFVAGATVAALYALDELKKSAPDGSPAFSRVLLEMAISR